MNAKHPRAVRRGGVLTWMNGRVGRVDGMWCRLSSPHASVMRARDMPPCGNRRMREEQAPPLRVCANFVVGV